MVLIGHTRTVQLNEGSLIVNSGVTTAAESCCAFGRCRAFLATSPREGALGL